MHLPKDTQTTYEGAIRVDGGGDDHVLTGFIGDDCDKRSEQGKLRSLILIALTVHRTSGVEAGFGCHHLGAPALEGHRGDQARRGEDGSEGGKGELHCGFESVGRVQNL